MLCQLVDLQISRNPGPCVIEQVEKVGGFASLRANVCQNLLNQKRTRILPKILREVVIGCYFDQFVQIQVSNFISFLYVTFLGFAAWSTLHRNLETLAIILKKNVYLAFPPTRSSLINCFNSGLSEKSSNFLIAEQTKL